MSDVSSAGMGQFTLEFGRGHVFDRMIIAQYLQDLVAQLDERERETVSMYFFHAMTIRDIESMTGRPRTTISNEKKSGTMKIAQLIMRDRKILVDDGFFGKDDE
jgi:DNA-directed RNA polymerase specialized sigma subunit